MNFAKQESRDAFSYQKARIVRITLFITVLTCFFTPKLFCAESIQPLKKAPEGFSWHSMIVAPISFLVPSGWHFYSIGFKGTFISRENIQKEGKFKTGLSFYLTKYDETMFSSAENWIESQISNILAATDLKVLARGVSKQSSQNLDLHWVIFEMKMPFGPTLAKQMFCYYPPKNIIFNMTFESPKEEWEASEKLGDAIVQNIRIGSE